MTIPSLRARQPAKSGTTWTMNIFHQLRTGGDPDFKDIYAEVPWLEFKERPDQPDEELIERWKQLPSPRAFKSHSMPGPDGKPKPNHSPNPNLNPNPNLSQNPNPNPKPNQASRCPRWARSPRSATTSSTWS